MKYSARGLCGFQGLDAKSFSRLGGFHVSRCFPSARDLNVLRETLGGNLQRTDRLSGPKSVLAIDVRHATPMLLL